jgi:RNA polymerase sigma-70 factor (ECF subfamily)
MTDREQHHLTLFRRIYESNVSSLVRFAQQFIDQEMAEDVVQDVFLELWEREQVFDKTSCRSYLFTAVRNRCINILKHEQARTNCINRVQLENQLLELDYLDSIEKQIIEKEDMQVIYDQIEMLPERCREILKLAYFEEKKSAEIAESLRLSVRTVEHQLYLGVRALRSKLLKRAK